MYNLNEIKSLPIVDVANHYGIHLKKKGDKLWGKLRDSERTSSLCINEKGNFWYDFGMSEGGSNIDLVMKLFNVDNTEAINRLASDFGIENAKVLGWTPLTNSQYKEIGIRAERATMNFKFDFEKHTPEQLDRWSKKYAIPIKDLAKKYPDMYIKMLNKISLKQIKELKEEYNYFKSNCKKYLFEPIVKGANELNMKELALKINNQVDLYERALLKKDPNIKELKEDFNKDIEVINNKINEVNKTIEVYKKNNFKEIEHFTVEQVISLSNLNKSMCKDNKILSFTKIKQLHKELTNKLQLCKDGKINLTKEHIVKLTKLFGQFTRVDMAIKEAKIIENNKNQNNNVKVKVLGKEKDILQI